MPRNVVVTPGKGKLVVIGAAVLLLASLGVWYYLNQSNYLGSEDSGATWMPSSCSTKIKCAAGQVSVCRPVKCRCNPIPNEKGFMTKNIRIVTADANVCVSEKDRYVKCLDENQINSGPVKPSSEAIAAKSELKVLNSLKDSISKYISTVRANPKASAAEKLLWKGLNATLGSVQKVIDEKTKIAGSYIEPTTVTKCTYAMPTAVVDDESSCSSICAQYGAQYKKGTEGVAKQPMFR